MNKGLVRLGKFVRLGIKKNQKSILLNVSFIRLIF